MNALFLCVCMFCYVRDLFKCFCLFWYRFDLAEKFVNKVKKYKICTKNIERILFNAV